MVSRRPVRKQRIVVMLCLTVIVSVFFVAVYQSYRYEELSRKVNRQETAQTDKLELNKRAIASIAVLSSPARIDTLARKQGNLIQNFPYHAIIIKPPRTLSERSASQSGGTP